MIKNESQNNVRVLFQNLNVKSGYRTGSAVRNPKIHIICTVCIYIYIERYRCVYLNFYTHTYTYKYIHIHTYTYMYIHIHVYVTVDTRWHIMIGCCFKAIHMFGSTSTSPKKSARHLKGTASSWSTCCHDQKTNWRREWRREWQNKSLCFWMSQKDWCKPGNLCGSASF